MKYINQLDYPHWLYVTRTDMDTEAARNRGKTTTISASGCGLCSAVMVADLLIPNCTVTLLDAMNVSYATKANHRIGTDYTRFAQPFADMAGLRLEIGKTTEDLLRCLHTGGAAVVHVAGDREDGHVGLFTRRGHYMAIIGQEADGRLIILDPSYKEGKFDEEGRQGKVEIRNGVIALCDPATVHAETKPIPYYLFWRK